jgi:hypothetical protein
MGQVEAGTEDAALLFIEPEDVAQVMGNRVTGTEPRIYVDSSLAPGGRGAGGEGAGDGGTGPVQEAASTPEEVFRQESVSLSPPATFPAVPNRNCVTVRWCGEHRKGSDQSVG